MPGFVRCGPAYAAPEQLEKPDLVNAATDIYSLGATFYHISFGAQPFRPGGGDEEILAFRKTSPMPSFSLERQEGFSAKYLRLIHDMLDPDPGKRPADPEALADRLERFHIADADETGSVARQARPVAGSPSASARTSRRQSRAVAAPDPAGAGRMFSLRRRPDSAAIGRNILWLWVCFAAAVLAAAGWILKG